MTTDADAARAQPMVHWVQAFLEAQAAELDAATNTQLAYANDLRDFAGWLTPKQQHFATLSREHVERYLIDLDAQGLSPSTRARRLSAIKQLYRFAFEEGWRSDNPAIQVKGPGKTKALPKTLSHEEVDRLIDAASAHKRDGLRNACLHLTRSRPTRCGMPLPHIFWPAAQTCARSKRCWGTRMSRPRKSIHMLSMNGSRRW